MPYIIKYQSGGMDKYSYDITTLEQVKSKLQKIGEGDKAVRYNHLSFNDFSNQQPNGFQLSQEALSYYFGDSTPVPNAEIGLEEEIVPEQSNAAKKKSHLLFVILLAIACIVGGIAIVYSKQKKDARNARAQTRAVQAAGFDITGTYTKKEIHEITDAINHGNGTITMDEFNNILSRKTREKMCSNGDIKVFPRLIGLGGTASAGNGAQFKNRKRSTKGWTERMNANNGLLVCRSNYRSRFSPRYNYYAFLPNPDSKDGCRGVMMIIMMQYNKEVQSFTVFYPEFSATYEVRDGKVHFTNCYEWHFSNFEKGRRKRIPDDFDGTWSVNEGVLKMDTKMYDAQWSRWLDATIVEEDMHEFRVDRLRDEFARLARYD